MTLSRYCDDDDDWWYFSPDYFISEGEATMTAKLPPITSDNLRWLTLG